MCAFSVPMQVFEAVNLFVKIMVNLFFLCHNNIKIQMELEIQHLDNRALPGSPRNLSALLYLLLEFFSLGLPCFCQIALGFWFFLLANGQKILFATIISTVCTTWQLRMQVVLWPELHSCFLVVVSPLGFIFPNGSPGAQLFPFQCGWVCFIGGILVW